MESIPFYIKDCAISAIALGIKAFSLSEFRDKLAEVHPGCFFYHFWSSRLRPQFTHPEYHNDFAAWAYRSLHDQTLAERLGSINPTGFQSIEDLRQEVVNIVEERLDEQETIPWAKVGSEFHFIRSNIIIFETPQVVVHPADLAPAIQKMTTGSIFYHFIDARRRGENRIDDFSTWLSSYGSDYADLIRRFKEIDPFFQTLGELRQELTSLAANINTPYQVCFSANQKEA